MSPVLFGFLVIYSPKYSTYDTITEAHVRIHAIEELLFRGKLLAALKKLYREVNLSFFGSARPFEDKRTFMALMNQLYRSKWVVYAKAPMCGPEQSLPRTLVGVVRYLGRYTHRIAISNRRILNIADDKVTFAYKDRRDKDRDKTMTLDTVEFIRRFLLHVPPHGFHKIRHFGLVAIRNRKSKLASAQAQLGPVEKGQNLAQEVPFEEVPLTARPPCQACGANNWVCIEVLPTKVFKATMGQLTARPPPTGAITRNNPLIPV